MGLLSSIVLLPLAPVRGVVWLGEMIQDEVERQLHDPAQLRRELEEIDRAEAAGHLSRHECEEARQAILDRMIRPTGGAIAADGKE
ncbi:gas vesicle protein GvpG [Nocardia arizonensis]|uniref:gas vesicle protein GvpG n=1 Tax=Nocardia arizonensis TaxID=1141647 RepID=UPI0006CF8685|nr:gas vesicle protein GvpG [Nocardia arizonensis]